MIPSWNTHMNTRAHTIWMHTWAYIIVHVVHTCSSTWHVLGCNTSKKPGHCTHIPLCLRESGLLSTWIHYGFMMPYKCLNNGLSAYNITKGLHTLRKYQHLYDWLYCNSNMCIVARSVKDHVCRYHMAIIHVCHIC